MHIHIKTSKTLRHVSVLRPPSGSYIFLAKITLEMVTVMYFVALYSRNEAQNAHP